MSDRDGIDDMVRNVAAAQASFFMTFALICIAFAALLTGAVWLIDTILAAVVGQ